ncbi:MAG: hypothetical protein LUF26_04550 [Firmicutes bacterium]|nr:hypothetical protein [Bacillota bacterium]
MIWTEKKNNINLTDIKDKLNAMYSSEHLGKNLCWTNKYGTFFKVFCFSENNRCFGIEYASNEDEARQGCFEDGDLFYIDDYSSLDDMVAAMRLEIDDSESDNKQRRN